MTRIYVDVEAAAIGGAGESSLDPAALRALRFLAEAGHDLSVVVAAGSPAFAASAASEELRAVPSEIVTEVPIRPPAQSWYLTTAVERCHGASAKLRTVLIGAAPPPGSIHRCDAVARDLQAAAMELLAAEAMPPR